MALTPWKKISEAVVATNRWWTYKRDDVILPSGQEGEYHYVHTNGSSMVVPVTDDGRIVMVNQFRYLVARESLEFPCGSVKSGSSYEETARQELTEETGYSAARLSLAGEFNPYNGVTDEMCRVYLARDLRHVGGVPDETEEFEVVLVTPEEIGLKIADGTLWDGMSIAGWGIVRAMTSRRS